MSRLKFFLKYVFPVIILIIGAALSLAILNFDSIIEAALWFRILVDRGSLNRQDMIRHFSSTTGRPISFFPAKTVAGEYIEGLYFYQCIAKRSDVESFIKKYELQRVTSKEEQKRIWESLIEYFKKSKVILPGNVSDIICDTSDRLNIGPLYICISNIKKGNPSNVLVTIFCIRI